MATVAAAIRNVHWMKHEIEQIRETAEDIEKALTVAHAAFSALRDAKK